MIKRLLSTTNNYHIEVTNSAWDKIIQICKIQKIKRFLFSATTGGCNGFNYKLNALNDDEYKKIYNTHTSKTKLNIIKKDNTELLIDPMVEFLLAGTTIDYIQENFSKNIFENKFIFIPNKTLATSCGCGISFTPKN